MASTAPQNVVAEAEQLLSKCKNLSQRVSVFAGKLTGDLDAFKSEVQSLKQAIKKAKQACTSAIPEDAVEAKASLQEAEKCIQGVGPGGDLNRFCNPPKPVLVRLLLGRKVNLINLRPDQSQELKQEYHSFRDSASLIMFLGPLLLYLGLQRADMVRSGDHQYTFTPWIMTGVQLYLAWMSYFYVAMALRENILLINGSNIKPWWIHHHYWSAAASLFMLSLPVYSQAVYHFFKAFLLWSCFQAAVMFVQNRYQQRRMYTRILLGKNSAMDVVSGESSGSFGQLLLLYPLLLVLQLWQVGIGIGVAWRTLPALLSTEGWLEVEPQGKDLRGNRGVCIVGIIFAYLAVMNFRWTVQTLIDKRKYASKMKKTKSRGSLAAGKAQ